MDTSKLTEGLNTDQVEAVTYTEGPLLVLAGAGSGKTKVLTHRVAYLIERKIVSPENCLLLTFTNKAAKEMKHRMGEINLGFAGTFHGFCAKVLKTDGKLIGILPNFLIYDDSDQARFDSLFNFRGQKPNANTNSIC